MKISSMDMRKAVLLGNQWGMYGNFGIVARCGYRKINSRGLL